MNDQQQEPNEAPPQSTDDEGAGASNDEPNHLEQVDIDSYEHFSADDGPPTMIIGSRKAGFSKRGGIDGACHEQMIYSVAMRHDVVGGSSLHILHTSIHALFCRSGWWR